ncbi:MAG: hypothetical protein ACREMT_11100, partial [Vulcanimicrobiaceae bacterium]
MTAPPAFAQSASDTAAKLQALQAQLDALKAQIDAMKAQQMQQMQQMQPSTPVTKTEAPKEQFVRLKSGNSVTFLVGKKDEATVY